uniref:Uncharacterized protein n=1 Tax=Strigamia maritima TaxID=126957 RepID=T1JE15_STRMM
MEEVRMRLFFITGKAEPYIIGTGYHSNPHHGPLNPSRPHLGYIQRYSCQRKGKLEFPFRLWEKPKQFKDAHNLCA